MSEQKRILVVDDEPEIRDMLAAALKKKKYEVVTAADGRAAFEALVYQRPHVVISDIRMAMGDGIELMERVTRLQEFRPAVILITGMADYKLDELADKGATAVIEKPFRLQTIFECIDKIFVPFSEKWQQRRLSVRINAVLEVSVTLGDKVAHTKTCNIGNGGVFFALHDNFPNIDELVSFKIFRPDASRPAVEGVGRVKWVRRESKPDLPSGCGLEFVELSEDSRAVVLELLSSSKANAFIPRK